MLIRFEFSPKKKIQLDNKFVCWCCFKYSGHLSWFSLFYIITGKFFLGCWLMLGGWSATISNDTISGKSSSHKIRLKYSKLTLFSHNLVLHNRPLMTKIGACSSQFFGEEKNAAECRISQHLVLLLVPMNELLLHWEMFTCSSFGNFSWNVSNCVPNG